MSFTSTQGDEEICDLTAALPEHWQVTLRGVVYMCLRACGAHVSHASESSLSRFLMLPRLQPIDPINFLKFGEDAFRRADESVVDGIARVPISQIEILSPVKIF